MEKTRKVKRQEHKYLLNSFQSVMVHSRLSDVLAADKHNGAIGYRVKSLYFDTREWDDLYDKFNGVSHRAKIRLRIYDEDSDMVLLEQKAKYGDYQQKLSWPLTKKEAVRFIKGDYAVIFERYPDFPADVYYQIIRRRPVMIVEYNRIAFYRDINSTRITLDSDIKFTRTNLDLFERKLYYTPLSATNETVLEVKYNQKLEPFIYDVISPYCTGRLSFGKYERCLMR